VEIVDPACFPRTKICGEFLNPQAVGWLAEHGFLPSLLELSPFPVYGMKITDHEGRSFTGHYLPRRQGTGYAIQRRSFDALLVAKAREAGIQIFEGHRAQRLLFERDRVVGVVGIDQAGRPFEKRARLVVGADGRNNLIGRTFGWMKPLRHLRKYAFVSYFEDLPGLDHYGEVHVVRDGYVGIAPITTRLANVALVVDEKAHPPGQEEYGDFLVSRIRESRLRQRFENLNPVAPVISTGPLAFEMERTSGHGTLLVGDTCGFIDPFTGEGINYAFLSASLAAPVLESVLKSDDLSALARYDQERNKAFSRKFQMAKLLQRAIQWPSLSGFLVKRFARSLHLGDTIVSAVGSAIPVEQVWNFRFLLKVMIS